MHKSMHPFVCHPDAQDGYRLNQSRSRYTVEQQKRASGGPSTAMLICQKTRARIEPVRAIYGVTIHKIKIISTSSHTRRAAHARSKAKADARHRRHRLAHRRWQSNAGMSALQRGKRRAILRLAFQHPARIFVSAAF